MAQLFWRFQTPIFKMGRVLDNRLLCGKAGKNIAAVSIVCALALFVYVLLVPEESVVEASVVYVTSVILFLNGMIGSHNIRRDKRRQRGFMISAITVLVVDGNLKGDPWSQQLYQG